MFHHCDSALLSFLAGLDYVMIFLAGLDSPMTFLSKFRQSYYIFVQV